MTLKEKCNIQKHICDGGVFYEFPTETFGIGILVFNIYSDYQQVLHSDILNHNEFSNESVIAEITDFYPNGLTKVYGYDIIKKNCGRGYASRLLDEMIYDCIENKAEILYAKTNQVLMRDFLKHKDFTQIPVFDGQNTHHYKILKD